MCHGDTFDGLIAGLSEEHRVIEANTEAARIRWLGRVAMLLPTIRAAEDDFRHACIHQGIARYGRTETMLLRMLVPEINTKTAQRWTDCIIYVVDHGAADAEAASAMIVATGGVVKTHEAYRAEHFEVAESGNEIFEEDAEEEQSSTHEILRVAASNGGEYVESEQRYWLTPPDIYAGLNEEFGFDFDPCPYPRPFGFDGLSVAWGKVSYCNPPFRAKDALGGRAATPFVRKAIEEHKKGKTVVLLLPTNSYVNTLLEAGAELRSAGRIHWLDATTHEPYPYPPPVTCFILRGHRVAPDRVLPLSRDRSEPVTLGV
jgi:hypothetical protein